ncbi:MULTISPECIES: S8 family peptidase [unclassified Actinomyces]|nr:MULTISPECIES: S8 family peptidase [unclassified Actinomyces]MCL3777310.1 S8 family serine peptidase [Actinomyces sp. AC-20-1]MCL3790414.1 S8 family serine peptidase [Actinomyces sp. 187325]MCL3792689.1 S8 family serine peptidase [Actinomyces sp. 186855]MCL3795087.1 S8 family serine peptidase [Actinomyces sp. 217892]
MRSTRRPIVVVLVAAALAAALVLALVISGVLPTGSGTGAGGATPTTGAEAPDVVAAPGTAQTAPPSEEADPDRFVISYDEGSPAAEVLASVEAYGQDILADLPSEQREAILAAAEQASVVIEAITAHSGAVAAIDLAEGLTDEQVAQFTSLLEQIESITSVEPDLQLTPLDTHVPDDAYFSYQWNLTDQDHGIAATDAWATSTGEGVTVAVIDTGVLADHPDLEGQLLPGYDFVSDPVIGRDGDGRDADPSDEGDGVAQDECGDGWEAETSSWHGSHVAGIIAAAADDGTGVAGVAPGARIVPVRALGRCGGYSTDAVDALTWASGGHVNGVPDNPHPAQVINMSLGGAGTCPMFYQKAINAAVARGSVVVVAAGNEDQDAALVSPASCRNVITVGATSSSGARAYYSNYGSAVDLSAPGGDVVADGGVLSLSNMGETAPTENAYAFMEGTSQAAPHVAGTIALLMALDPDLTQDEALALLQETATPVTTCDRDSCGGGVVNAAAAVERLSASQPGEPRDRWWKKDPAPAPTPSPSPRSGWHKNR